MAVSHSYTEVAAIAEVILMPSGKLTSSDTVVQLDRDNAAETEVCDIN